KTGRESANMEIDILPTQQRLIKQAQPKQRFPPPDRTGDDPRTFKKQKPQEIVSQQFFIPLFLQISRRVLEHRRLECGEIEIIIPPHSIDPTGQTIWREKVVRIEKHDKFSDACSDADVTTNARARFVARASRISNPRIGCHAT